MIASTVCPTVFVCDEASESSIVGSLFVSTTTSIDATSLVVVFVVTISAIGAIAVHVLLYLFQDSWNLELNCIVGERFYGRFIWRSFIILLFLCVGVLLHFS